MTSATFNPTDTPRSDTSDYRARARRVRAMHRDRPATMYAALRELADEADAQFNRLFNVPTDAEQAAGAQSKRTNEILDAILDDLETAKSQHAFVTVRRARKAPDASTVATNPLIDEPAATSPSTIFSDEVAAVLDGDVLRYSERERLIRRAAELGIDRFDANLLIAMVVKREGISHYPAAASGVPATRNPWLLPVAFAVGAQLALIAGLWWMVSRVI